MFTRGTLVTRRTDGVESRGAFNVGWRGALFVCVGLALTLGGASRLGSHASTIEALQPGSVHAPVAASELPATVSGRYVVAGSIGAMVRSGGTVYVGGEFSRIADRTGSAIIVPAGGGASEPVRAEIGGGSVSAAVADDQSGWYLGGSFSNVGEVRRAGLAHLRPDGTLDPVFAPADFGENAALALAGGVLYVGGRQGLHALDATTGSTLPVRYTAPQGAGAVRALVANAGRLYAAFSEAGILAFDAARGARVWTHALPSASPNDVGTNTLALDGSKLLVGGGFEDRGRKNLEVLDAASGRLVGGRLQVPKSVYSIVLVGGTVYLALPRKAGLAIINLATGALRTWGAIRPSVLGTDGSTVYAAGVTSREERFLERVYAARAGTAHAVLRPISPLLAKNARTLAAQPGHVLVGGTFTGVGGAVRHNLAAFDMRTGALRAWRPKTDLRCCGVHALALAGNRIYFGGDFDHVLGSRRQGLAAVTAEGVGRLLPWRPSIRYRGSIHALAVARGRVFVGGSSFQLDRPKRRVAPRFANLVAFSASGTGARLRFSSPVRTTFDVDALAVWRRTLLVGANGENASMMVALPVGGDGRHQLWRRKAECCVLDLLVRGATLYAGGNFSRVSRRPRRNLAALALSRHGALLPFAPGVPIAVEALTPLGGDLVFGGQDIDGPSRQVLGAVSWDGRLEQWHVDVPPGGGIGGIDSVAGVPDGLLVAGSFDWLGPPGQQAPGGIAWLR
jgi:outer membrane protein assembly factor BamB